MAPLKVFATQKNTANFSCPSCKNMRQMDVSRFIPIEKQVKLKYTCNNCGEMYSVILERRRYARKAVRLPGKILKSGKTIPVEITNISRHGIGAELLMQTGENKIRKEDRILLEFTLDDAEKSRISKDMIVKTISPKEIGCRFESNVHYDKLGTYILFHFS